MSHFEFEIPLQKDKLLESQVDKYHVEDVVQPRLLLSHLQGKYSVSFPLNRTRIHLKDYLSLQTLREPTILKVSSIS